jgi:anti-anti-sigma regulatory factor
MPSRLPSGTSMTEVQGCLVVSLQSDMDDAAFAALHQEFAQRLVDNRLPDAIFNFAGVQLLDLHEFERVRRLAQVAGFLGAEVVCVALAPGIAAFLALADTDLHGMRFCLHMEDAFALLAAAPP